jgi:hypothetical protein
MVLFPAWQGCVAIEDPEDDGSYSLPLSKRPAKNKSGKAAICNATEKSTRTRMDYLSYNGATKKPCNAKTSVKHAECRGSLIVAGFVRQLQVETEA